MWKDPVSEPATHSVILGLETSCDETAAALVTDDGTDPGQRRRVAGRPARALRRRRARGRVAAPPRARDRRWCGGARRAGPTLDDVDAVAVTQGPGLIGALLVGAARPRRRSPGRGGCRSSPSTTCTGHVASLYLEPEPLEPPFLCLLASGGHTLLARRAGARRVRACSGRRSTTPPARRSTRARGCSGSAIRAAREIDRLAREGDPEAFAFPVARVAGLDFSFSGREDRAALRGARARRAGLEERRADLAASYQRAIVRALVETARARPPRPARAELAVVGGVAANSELRAALPDAALAPLALCTDNAAMIASAARYARGGPAARVTLGSMRTRRLRVSRPQRSLVLAAVAARRHGCPARGGSGAKQPARSPRPAQLAGLVGGAAAAGRGRPARDRRAERSPSLADRVARRRPRERRAGADVDEQRARRRSGCSWLGCGAGRRDRRSPSSATRASLNGFSAAARRPRRRRCSSARPRSPASTRSASRIRRPSRRTARRHGRRAAGERRGARAVRATTAAA